MGMESTRLAFREFSSARGVAISAEDIVLTSRTSAAYSFVFRLLCNPGDELLIPAPSYPLFGFLADILDVKLVRYPLIYDHGWQIIRTTDNSAQESAIHRQDCTATERQTNTLRSCCLSAQCLPPRSRRREPSNTR